MAPANEAYNYKMLFPRFCSTQIEAFVIMPSASRGTFRIVVVGTTTDLKQCNNGELRETWYLRGPSSGRSFYHSYCVPQLVRDAGSHGSVTRA